jgi:glycerate kinase
VRQPVHDPLGRPLDAELGLLDGGRLAVVESARASGIGLLDANELDPEAASTFGTGELIAAACARGARRIVLAVGGSASTDGGAGAIERGGGLGGAQLTVLADVSTPFERAAAVFAPQKGADPEAVRRLAARLDAQAGALPRDPRGVPMSGAAGGLAGGLWARFDATLVSGSAWVLDAVGFDRRLRRASAVVTGEGRLDATTLEDKLVGEIARRCAAARVPLRAVVGSCALSARQCRRLGLASVRQASSLDQLRSAGRSLAAGEAGAAQ